MKISFNIGNRNWSLSTHKISTKQQEEIRLEPIQRISKNTNYCLKCGCILFPEETMCPDCLFPVKDNKGWTA